jgi:hypothetical protein
MKMRPTFLMLAGLPLAACTIAQSEPTNPLPEGPCRNEPLAQFIGQPASQQLGAQMMAASGARTIRWVPKGGVITMDFSPARLTVQLDGSNRVETARCG